MEKSTVFSRPAAAFQRREYVSPGVEVSEILCESGIAASIIVGGDPSSDPQIIDILDWNGWE